MQAELRFTWARERNPRDYREWGSPRPARPVAPKMEDILHDRWPRIVAKGVCLDRYEPLAEFPDLYERFIASSPRPMPSSSSGHSGH